jgi:hypothetical protein
LLRVIAEKKSLNRRNSASVQSDLGFMAIPCGQGSIMISKSKLLKSAWATAAVICLAAGTNAFTAKAYADHDDDERWEHHRHWNRWEDREGDEEAREAWRRHEWWEHHRAYDGYYVAPQTYYVPAPPAYYVAPQPYYGGAVDITIPIR